MEKVSRLKMAWNRFRHYRYWKYILTVVLAIVIIGFVDESSVYNHIRHLQKINELQTEINKYKADYQRDQYKLQRIESNPKEMEKIARERYFMKQDDEDIFVLSDDE